MTQALATADRSVVTPGGDPAVVARGLVRRFGELAAVDGVDLEVPRGEIYGFLGPNGAGKSTVVRMLCTLLRPSEGTASVAGFDVETEAQHVRLRIGVALQEAALDDLQTGRELLSLQGRLFGLSFRQARRRVNDVLSLVNIGDAIDRRVGTYSGGMKRRLDLAVALVHQPEVLFLDEPTTGLDPVSRATVWAEVRRLNHELGMTIFLTTQYLEEADALAHRVGIIDAGKVVAEDTPASLKHALADDVVTVGLDGDPDVALGPARAVPGVRAASADGPRLVVRAADGDAVLAPLAVALDDAGVVVRRLEVRTPTLDDVFFQLTGRATGTP